MIYIQTLQLKWEPGKENDLGWEFEQEIAKVYLKRVQEAIRKQLYRSRYRPYSRSYEQYKRKKGLSYRYWVATGELFRAIRLDRKKDDFKVGFPNRRHRNSNLKLIEISRIMEYGSMSRRIPPRPLFRFVLEDLKKDMKLLVYKFQKFGHCV